jgi:DNA invertase Pin-like site-specific DNA recombinase
MKAAFYARVSTGHQDPENQVLKLREFAAAAGHELAAEYIDVETGKIAGRRQFQAMMHDARRRRFEVLLFFSFSRLTREGPQRTAMYLHELDQAGVSYVSITEKKWLDSTGPLAFVITMLMATIAQMEVDQLSARTKAGLERARAQGKQIGRPRRVVDRVKLAEWKGQGLSVEEIARRSGVSPRTVGRRMAASA